MLVSLHAHKIDIIDVNLYVQYYGWEHTGIFQLELQLCLNAKYVTAPSRHAPFIGLLMGFQLHMSINKISLKNKALIFFIITIQLLASVYTGRLAVAASVRVNDTVLCCLLQDGINPSRKSDQSTLLVISGIVDTQLPG